MANDSPRISLDEQQCFQPNDDDYLNVRNKVINQKTDLFASLLLFFKLIANYHYH